MKKLIFSLSACTSLQNLHSNTVNSFSIFMVQ
jgi:hypothetical protein